MRTGKIGLRYFLYNRHVPGFDSPECPCGMGAQTVPHVLLICRRHTEERERMWMLEEDGTTVLRRTLDLKTLLNTPKYCLRAAKFMKDTGLLGQFRSDRPT